MKTKPQNGRPKGVKKVLFNVRIPSPLMEQFRKYCEKENLPQTVVAEKAFRQWMVTN